MRWLLNGPRSQGKHCTAPSVEKWPAGHWSHSPPGPLAVQRRRAGQGMVRRRCMRTHCTHPLAPRPRCWWRVSTQSACLIAHLCARTWTGEVTDHAWAAWSSERSRRARARETSGVLARVRGKAAGAAAPASTGGLGWYYVHAEGFGATLQDRGHVTGTRGLHKGAALASYSPNCTF